MEFAGPTNVNMAKILKELEAKPSESLSPEEEEAMKTLQQYRKLFETRRLEKYFDKKGNPMSFWEWSGYFNDLEYNIIGKNDVGPFTVSTIWLGMDLNFVRMGEKQDVPPLIFETMIFDDREENPDSPLSMYQERYATEQEALIGHEVACRLAEKEFEKLKGRS